MVAALGVVISGLVAVPAPPAEAAVASAFDPGEIISDENFFAGSSMDTNAVQSFLNARRPECVSGYTCMVDYTQATPSMAESRYCSALTGASRESAASIIARVGAACGVSPRVLLVLLEKEQSLVTHRSPSATRYAKATGFGCPDTAPCDPTVGGFFYQVYYAARQFQVYKTFPQNYNHIAGRVNNVLYNPNAACGSSPVLIRNQATAGLYNYTPYQPNAAALANLYGTGDNCSAYGNRNFWRIWTDWFGDPRSSNGVNPFGVVQSVTTTPARAVVSGYAIDPSAPAQAIQVNLYIDGVWKRTYQANQANIAAGGALAGAGSNHGFAIEFAMSGTPVEMCIAALNVGDGKDQWIDCRTVNPPSGPPFGQVDGASAKGLTATVSGWAIDPDTAAPINVHAYVNGRYAGAFRASASRPDVGAIHRDYGANHGYSFQVPIPVGTSDVCVYAIAVPMGDNPMLGCREVSNASGPPVGQLDSASAAPGSITASGWAIDPDTPASIDVQLLVDGKVVASSSANTSRPDVGRVHAGYGAAHGYSLTASATGGQHSVCVRAVNVRGGTDTTLGCRTVEVPSGSPMGRLDSVEVNTATGALTVNGWAIDPDTTAPVNVRLYVNGALRSEYVANGDRPDVGRVYPAYGAAHGLQSARVTLQPGMNQICIWALNTGAGEATLLNCRWANISGTPFGMLDSASVDAATGRLQLNGWAIEPDTAASPMVNLYVDGALVAQERVTASRPDVARVYPLFGGNRGLGSLNTTVTPGSHSVCAWVVNEGPGSSRLLGCKTVAR
ncbi:MAG: hypothetical protein WC580_06580 [Agrococcus sp.]